MRRTTTHTVRLSADEKRALEEEAADAGLSVSAVLRYWMRLGAKTLGRDWPPRRRDDETP